ncbi:tetratricopeptide repeat-containing diguanylate cyclase [Aliikangiella sp. IMCC44632]
MIFNSFSFTSSLEETVDSFYRTEPSVVIKAINQLSQESFYHLDAEVLVKASYASAITANVDLTLKLTNILLEKAILASDPLLEGKAHYNRGAVYASSGNHDLALDSFLLSLASFENTQSESEIARIKGALALIYTEIGEYDLALPYFEEALQSHLERNDQTNIAMVLQNRAFMKIQKGEFAEPRQDLLKALQISIDKGLKSNFPIIYKNLGKIETELNGFEQAEEYFELALKHAKENNLTHHLSEISLENARLMFKQNKLLEAKSLLSDAIRIAEQYSLLKHMRNSYRLLAKILAQQGEYQQAYQAQELANALAEKMGESRIASNLSRLDRYTTQIKEQNKRLVLEKEKEIAMLDAERQHWLRNFSIVVAGFALLVAIIFIRRYIYSNQRADLFEKQSKIDSLTGVWNRRAGEAQLARLCNRNLEGENLFCIAMLDIDHFKQVNDKFGHDMGDKAIIHLCHLIEINLRPSDMLCRWGGEEFIIILDQTDTPRAFDICERIRSKVEASEVEGIGQLTVSIGITQFEQDDIYELVKRGDQGLYKAKDSGRNQIVVKTKK